MKFCNSFIVLSLALVSTLMLSGCQTSNSESNVTTGMGGSRSKIYSSIQEVADDSAFVVMGQVTQQSDSSTRRAGDVPSTDFTVSSVIVKQIRQTSSNKFDSTSLPSVGSTIEVRQLGNLEMSEVPAKILEAEKVYLLFLTPTDSTGDDASQFFITGGTAGYYAAPDTGIDSVDNDTTFTKVDDEGDAVPPQLTWSDVQ